MKEHQLTDSSEIFIEIMGNAIPRPRIKFHKSDNDLSDGTEKTNKSDWM